MMDDLISRRDAINVVSEITTTMSVCTNKDECYGMKRMQKQAITELEHMPSAEPDTTTHDSNVAKKGKNDGDGTSGDCISRTQAIDALRDYLVGKRCPDDGTLTCRLIENEVINKLPSVQPECKTGRWIEMSSTNHTYKCSECGRLLVNVSDGKNNVSKHYPYCHCGAKMEGEKKE